MVQENLKSFDTMAENDKMDFKNHEHTIHGELTYEDKIVQKILPIKSHKVKSYCWLYHTVAFYFINFNTHILLLD